MILIGLSLLFLWMIFREISGADGNFDKFSMVYVTVLGLLALACIRPIYQTWRLEVFLSENASVVSGRNNVKVKCRSVYGTLFAGIAMKPGNRAGTAYIHTGEIFFENGWCKSFKQYLKNPESASDDEVFSMHVYVHEVMHIRGERNEGRTDCQAIQRGHHIGEMLGVNPITARINTLRYYNGLYKHHPYFSKHCRPGGKWDEKLDDSIWAKTAIDNVGRFVNGLR